LPGQRGRERRAVEEDERAADRHVVFLTLEDETGLFNGIVHPHVYERYRRVLRGEPMLVIEGPMQVQDEVRHVLVRRAWPLFQDPSAASVPRVPSHDFH
jgi:error-prone DNA polymerase